MDFGVDLVMVLQIDFRLRGYVKPTVAYMFATYIALVKITDYLALNGLRFNALLFQGQSRATPTC